MPNSTNTPKQCFSHCYYVRNNRTEEEEGDELLIHKGRFSLASEGRLKRGKNFVCNSLLVCKPDFSRGNEATQNKCLNFSRFTYRVLNIFYFLNVIIL